MELEWTDAGSAPPEVRRYLDGGGRVASWPGRKKARADVLAYLAARFQAGQIYSEREVNTILLRALACNDCASVRRDLCDLRYLARERDGSRYWRVEA
jgi:hypothetical protein